MATNILTQNGAFRMDASLASASDVCPVCKSTAQTSPNLRFKVSSKCYHRICEGCVDRKFSAGKAQCPISGCHHLLWKRDWRLQTFEDIQVEREVDIRRRVWRTFDLTNLGLVEPDAGWETVFEDLRSYNDYLELKEELAMNLIHNTDINATNKKLRDYETANGLRKEKEEGKPQAKAVVRQPGENPDLSGLIKGLKVKRAMSPKLPAYDVWEGVSKGRDYFSHTEKYESSWDRYTSKKATMAGGWDLKAYTEESLLRAFSGLGVFIGNEKSGQSDMRLPLATTAPHADDVF